MTWAIVAGIALLFALLPAVLYARNVRIFRTPPFPERALPAVSILIPARNEARAIEAALAAALASRGLEFEIVVLDDHSEDDTAARVQRSAASDPRVRLEFAPELPAGWCGKQHACFTLSKMARHSVLCFVDADVRLAPDGLARLLDFLETSGADLVSGFPLQQTETFLEKLLIPLIHFLLLGFLPFARMRQSRRPGYGAGCGQLFMVKRDEYEKSGGHERIKASLHDGITLPRAFRQQGFATDLCDATSLAVCRMYGSAPEVWFGLAKNAREGLADSKLVVPVTLMLLAGQVLPAILLFMFLWQFFMLVTVAASDFETTIKTYEQTGLGMGLAFSSLGTLALYYPRIDSVLRFRQTWISALLHPFGIVVLLAIQWFALMRAVLGRPSSWKGRRYG